MHIIQQQPASYVPIEIHLEQWQIKIVWLTLHSYVYSTKETNTCMVQLYVYGTHIHVWYIPYAYFMYHTHRTFVFCNNLHYVL